MRSRLTLSRSTLSTGQILMIDGLLLHQQIAQLKFGIAKLAKMLLKSLNIKMQ